MGGGRSILIYPVSIGDLMPIAPPDGKTSTSWQRSWKNKAKGSYEKSCPMKIEQMASDKDDLGGVLAELGWGE